MTTSRREFLKSTGALVVYFSLPGCSPDAGIPPATPADGSVSLGNWIRLQSDGTVILSPGKVELGQGISTALAQIAAEELGVEVQRISLAPVDTDYSPDESYTFSSISIQQSGPKVRQAAAAGRKFLLQRAAKELGKSPAELTVADGQIFAVDQSTGMDYWQLLAGETSEVTISGDDPEQPVGSYGVVGTPVQRLDIPGKVFGEPSYLQDLRLPGMVHARLIRPPAERAQLQNFQAGPAESMVGVLKIVRDGNFVAVIAEREGQARDAAGVLRNSLNWDLPGDLPDSDKIYEWLKSAPARIEEVASQRSDQAADAQTREFEAVYQRPYQAHASISPSAAIALFKNGKLTVWSHAQGMFPLRTAIAHTLGLDIEQVRCIYRQAAGCYGHNGGDDAACDAAALALLYPDSPVRLQWERADEFAWEPYGSAMHIETRAEMDESGRIVSWDHDVWSCPHTSRPRSAALAGHLIYAQHREDSLGIPQASSIPQPAGGADRNAIPLYSFANMNITKHLVTDVPLRVSALRGLGAYANVFAIESFMDEMALAAGEDPLAFRIRHLDDPRAVAVLEKLGQVSNWAGRPKAATGEGWGLSFARFKNLASYIAIVFQLRVDQSTGEISLDRAIAVCDAGLVVNPDGLRAQVEGSIVQSASWTLREQVRFSKERIESRDWASYPILRFDEVPNVEVFLIERNDEKSLGVGETAQGPTAAAMANAVYHASGRRLRRLPLSPEHFLAAGA